MNKATGVKEDLDITAVYKINTYTVRFYNGSGNQVGATQKVNYLRLYRFGNQCIYGAFYAAEQSGIDF